MIPANSANFFFFKNIFPSCFFYLLSININEVSQWKICSVGDGKEGKEETDCWHLPDAVFGSKPQIKNVLSNCPRSPNLHPQTHHLMQKYIDIKTRSYSQCLLFESRSASSLFHCPLSLSLLLNAVIVFLSYQRFLPTNQKRRVRARPGFTCVANAY